MNWTEDITLTHLEKKNDSILEKERLE